MAKKDMKHYYTRHGDINAPTVPQINGKAKSGKEKARPMIPGAEGKVYHGTPHKPEKLSAYSQLDNDLAVENIENDFDMTAADLQDFDKRGE